MADYLVLGRVVAPFLQPGGMGCALGSPGAPAPLRGRKYAYRYAPTRGRMSVHEWCLVQVTYNGPESDILTLESSDLFVLGLRGGLVADMSVAKRLALRNLLDSFGASYNYQDQADTLITVPALPTGDLALLTMTELEVRLLDYFQNGKPTRLEGQVSLVDHNTEFTDDFSTDPFTANWTETMGTAWTWDDPNDEMDCAGGGTNNVMRRDADVGSNEMEAQGTFLLAGYGGTCCRHRDGTDDTTYMTQHGNGDNNIYWYRVVAGVFTDMGGTDPETFVDNQWYSVRLACQTQGANVVLSAWVLGHGASKPADPGWVGVDGSPTDTFSDGNAARILDADAQRGGLFYNDFGGAGSADWFKQREISDRAGAGRTTRNTLAAPLGSHLGRGLWTHGGSG